MATRVSRNQVVVRGGSLGESEGWWLSCLEMVNGCEFVSLSGADRRLAAYVGRDSDLAFSPTGFVDLLRRARNMKVDELIEALIDEEEAMSGGIKRRKVDYFESIDKVITIDVPALEGHTVKSLRVLATHRTSVKVCVELTEENLGYIREGCRTMIGREDTPRKKHRHGDDRALIDGCPDVHWNEQRRTHWIRWKDPDGRARHKSFSYKRSDVPEIDDHNRLEAARLAQDEFDGLNTEAETIGGGAASNAGDDVSSIVESTSLADGNSQI